MEGFESPIVERRVGFVNCRRNLRTHRSGRPSLREFNELGTPQTSVTAVTVWALKMGDTSIVNKVRGAGTKALFEPGDTRQQWKGEAATSFV